MTREEAIAVLRREIEPSVYEDEKSIAEAIDMAIEALQKESYLKDMCKHYRECASARPRDFVPKVLHDKMVEQLRSEIADSVSVVRCKECKWQKFIDWGMGDCLHHKGSKHIAYDNHFCSYGERKEE